MRRLVIGSLLLAVACGGEPDAPPLPPLPQAPPAEAPLSAAPADVIFIVVDTLRADRLHLYGSPRPTSPALDALAADAVVFDRAYAPSPWTLPSVASILTGLGPGAHTATETDRTLPEEVETLAERLVARGYEAAFFGVNPYLLPSRGLDQGFEPYQGLDGLSGAALNDRVSGYLRTRSPERPLFLYVHYFEPHCPYEPPEALAASLPPLAVATGRALTADAWAGLPDCYQLSGPDGAAQLSVDAYLDAYDGEVLQADGLVGSLLETLRTRGLYDGALIAVAGDHGESFWESGDYGHGRTLDEAAVRVPLVIRPPGGGARRVSEPVSLTGLAPTALLAAGVSPAAMPPRLRGGDLLGASLPTGVLVSTDYENASAKGYFTESYTLRMVDRLGTLTDASGAPMKDLQVEAALSLRLRTEEAAQAADGAHMEPALLPLDEDLLKQLRSIGYLH